MNYTQAELDAETIKILRVRLGHNGPETIALAREAAVTKLSVRQPERRSAFGGPPGIPGMLPMPKLLPRRAMPAAAHERLPGDLFEEQRAYSADKMVPHTDSPWPFPQGDPTLPHPGQFLDPGVTYAVAEPISLDEDEPAIPGAGNATSRGIFADEDIYREGLGPIQREVYDLLRYDVPSDESK